MGEGGDVGGEQGRGLLKLQNSADLIRRACVRDEIGRQGDLGWRRGAARSWYLSFAGRDWRWGGGI
jgi:hypothetical protein